MTTRAELVAQVQQWTEDHRSSQIGARWVMPMEDGERIKTELGCTCLRPGAPRSAHAPGCMGSDPARLARMFDWPVRYDAASVGVWLEPSP